MTTKIIDSEVRELAQVLGIDAESIEAVRPDWLALMKRGVLVSVHLRRWRATTTLTPEHLGLNFIDDQERKQFETSMSLGHLFLLPKRFLTKLSTIDSAARKVALKYGAVTYWGNFLTPESHADWLAEIEAYKANYYDIRDEIAADWDSIIYEVTDAQAANARAAYRREAQALAMGGKSAVASQMSESSFVNRHIDAVLNAIPSRQAVIDSFDFEIDYTYIPLPSLMAEDEAQAQIAYDNVKANRAALEAEQKMRDSVLAQYRDRYDKLIVGYMSDMIGAVNETLYNMASDVMAACQAKETLHPRSVVQVKKAIERVKSLNVFDYADIDQIITKASQIIETPPSERSLSDIEATLKDIATVTRANLVTLDSVPTRKGRKATQAQPVPTAPKAVRQARARLGLAEIEPTPQRRQSRKASQ